MTAPVPGGGGWRKSSLSFANGNCVEVSEDWRKSSRSTHNGACVEAGGSPAGVMVRDTADRGGPVLRLTPAGWSAFLARAARE